MSHECEFCGNMFNSKNSLTTHKKTAKYCLNTRSDATKRIQECEKCGKTFTNRSNLKFHEKGCVLRISKQIQKLLDDKDAKIENQMVVIQTLKKETDEAKNKIILLDKEIETLKEEITEFKFENSKLASDTKADIYEKEYKAIRDRPTTTYNTTTTNKLKLVKTDTIDPFTLQTVKDRLENDGYTYETFLHGTDGIKRFIIGLITKDDEKNYVTTDVSRPHFHRLEETRNWVNDKGAIFLTKVFDEMRPLVVKYFTRLTGEMRQAIGDDEQQTYDYYVEKTKPMALAIDSKPESKRRKELLDDVITYIRPRTAV